MPTSSELELWSSAAWRAQAVSWLDDRLAAIGAQRVGEVEQPHLRAWGTVLWAPTSTGPVWLKATGPANRFEVGLYVLLDRVAADRTPPVLGCDTVRGWVLLADGGPTLGDTAHGDMMVNAMAAVASQYGLLQRELMPHVGDLLALDVTDMRPAIMLDRFDEAIDTVGGYARRWGDAADRQTVRRALALRPVFAGWCEELAGLPMPASLNHNDLHPWNIFATGSGPAERARFYDWGDGVVAHPFSSMLVALGYLGHHHLGVPDDDPAVLRVRDAYLEVFTDLGSRAELLRGLELACRVGKVARCLTWARSIGAAGPAHNFADAPLECLAALTHESYLYMGA